MSLAIGIALVVGAIVFGISAYTAYETSKQTKELIEWKYPIGFALGIALLVIIIGAIAA